MSSSNHISAGLEHRQKYNEELKGESQGSVRCFNNILNLQELARDTQ